LIGFIDFILLNYLIGQLFYNYVLAIITDPGSVPKKWKPENIDEEKLKQIQEMSHKGYKEVPKDFNSITSVKWCRKCPQHHWKPPRAHHCSECERCVLKMDHHCPWVNNCVGHNNHKYFFLFLIHIVIQAIHMIFFFSIRIFLVLSKLAMKVEDNNLKIEVTLMIIQLIIIVPTLIAVCCLCMYQIQLISENTTSIESYEKEIEERKARKKGKTYRFPYDRGICRNCKDVLGSKISVWFWPTEPEMDGFDYKFVFGRHEGVEEV